MSLYMCFVCFGRQIDRWMRSGPRTAFKSWFSHFPMLVPRTQFRLSYLVPVPVVPSLWPRKKFFHCRQISKSIYQFLNLCMGLIFWEFDKCLPLENELDSNSLRAWVRQILPSESAPSFVHSSRCSLLSAFYLEITKVLALLSILFT